MTSQDELEGLEPLHLFAAKCKISTTPSSTPAFVNMMVEWRDGGARFLLDDEYGDARATNPALCVALLRQNKNELADAPTAAAWAHSIGLNVNPTDADEIYRQNLAAFSTLEDALGDLPDVVTNFDWSLNAGRAATLRNLG